MSDSFPNPTIEPEMQVRLMNLAMGEASDFESDQLQSLMEQRSELAAYFQHLQHMHGLLCQVGTISSASDKHLNALDDNWQLSPERRDKLLKFLDGQQPSSPVVVSLNSANVTKPSGMPSWITMMAVLAGAALLMIGLMMPAVQSAREAARRVGSVASSTDSYIVADAESKLEDLAENLKQSQTTIRSTIPSQSYRYAAPSGRDKDPTVAKGTMAEGRDFELTQAPSDGKAAVPAGQKGETVMAYDHDPNLYLGRQLQESKKGKPPASQGKDEQPRNRSAISLGGSEVSGGESQSEWFSKDRDVDGVADGKEAFHWNLAIPGIRVHSEEESLLQAEAKPVEVSALAGARNSGGLELSVKELVEEIGKSSPVRSSLDEFSLGEPALRQEQRLKRSESIDEQTAATEAFSTFSLHVSDVSFKLAQAALAQGQWPEAAKIRIEEFVNAIDYHDPLPAGDEKVACRVEQAIHPFLMQRNLLRVSMRTAAAGRSQRTVLRLTIVLDNSGSMERPDRRQAVLRAFRALTEQLRPTDQVTLISFANTPRLLADKLSGKEGAKLVELVEHLPSEGGTNIEAALKLAHEKALEQKLLVAQNRIVLLTDGAVNLGDAEPESLGRYVTKLRDDGIAFDAAGISAADLNDDVLEALTRQGDGRYYLLDSAEDAGEAFAAQIAGALRPSAQNVKVQVEFNADRVGRYKLLGYDQHRLNKEDFRNDQVDAAELAAAEAGVAVYHYEVKPNGTGDVGSVSVRFRDLSSGQMIEQRWPIPYDPSLPRLEQAAPSMQLAASAALLAAKLSGGALADNVDLAQLQKMLTNLPAEFAGQQRVEQLRTMVTLARNLTKD